MFSFLVSRDLIHPPIHPVHHWKCWSILAVIAKVFPFQKTKESLESTSSKERQEGTVCCSNAGRNAMFGGKQKNKQCRLHLFWVQDGIVYFVSILHIPSFFTLHSSAFRQVPVFKQRYQCCGMSAVSLCYSVALCCFVMAFPDLPIHPRSVGWKGVTLSLMSAHNRRLFVTSMETMKNECTENVDRVKDTRNILFGKYALRVYIRIPVARNDVFHGLSQSLERIPGWYFD